MSFGQGPQVGVLARACIFLVAAYRVSLGLWLGGSCRFVPSCSAYALDALHNRPLLRALGAIASRLLRCHPWHEGGFDPATTQNSAPP